jgi:hypothetical protein
MLRKMNLETSYGVEEGGDCSILDEKPYYFPSTQSLHHLGKVIHQIQGRIVPLFLVLSL